MLQDWFAKGA